MNDDFHKRYCSVISETHTHKHTGKVGQSVDPPGSCPAIDARDKGHQNRRMERNSEEGSRLKKYTSQQLQQMKGWGVRSILTI